MSGPRRGLGRVLRELAAVGVDAFPLARVAVHAEVVALDDVALLARRRHHDDGNAARDRVALDAAEHLEAGEARHLEVGDDQVRPQPRHRGQALRPAGEDLDLVPHAGEDLPAGETHRVVIVDDDDPLLTRRRSHGNAQGARCGDGASCCTVCRKRGTSSGLVR